LLNQSIDSMTISNSVNDPSVKPSSYLDNKVTPSQDYLGKPDLSSYNEGTSTKNVQVAEFKYRDSSASVGKSSIYKEY
jgi:hypothetical protein